MTHTPMVIAVDVDNTLTTETCWNEKQMRKAQPNQKMIDWVNLQHKTHNIVIHTARRWEYCQVTVDWLRKHGVKFHSIAMEKFPAHLYVDDCAVNPKEVL